MDLIIEVGKRLWTRGYVAANDGNISVKISENELLITPTGASKGFMNRDMVIRMTMDGEIISPKNQYSPSSEYKMHTQVYRQRDDINAVVHAHPPYSTAFAVAGISLDKYVLPEAVLTLGSVPVAPYGTPSTDEVPESIKEYIRDNNALLLANHGALTIGVDLMTAYHRMETLEHMAQIMYLANNLGNVNTLSKERIEQLAAVRNGMNIPGK
jgi:L-fuculose-phosphate aldolase